MTEKETISFLRVIGRKVDEADLKLKKLEDLVKADPRLGIILKGPIFYEGHIYPTDNGISNIGSPNNFINNIYLSGKIIYPDALDFGVNNDFCIDKMGKIGFHCNQKLDGVTIKGLPNFTIQNATYLGENTLFFQISSGTMEDFITLQDLALINNIPYQVIRVSRDKITIESLNGGKPHMEINEKYDLTVYNNLMGIKTNRDEDVLKINAFGDIFYKTMQKNADLNINGSAYFNQNVFIRSLDVGHLTIENQEAPLVTNLNAEFLCGKKGPLNGDLVSTKDKQQLWNKSFGDELVMNYNRIMDLGDPLYDMDATTKRYVDRYISGIKVNKSVKCASIVPLDADYERSEMKLHLRINENLQSNTLISAFDGVELHVNERVLIMNQIDGKYNGIYLVVSDGIESGRVVLQRTADFSPKKVVEDLKAYYVFIENGSQFGNTGVCFDYSPEFSWDDSQIRFNVFSRAESYGVGLGIKKTRNIFSLNTGEIFDLESGKLEIKKESISNSLLQNNTITLIGEGGIDLDKSVLKLGESMKIGLKVDRKQFHFGKNGELQMKNIGKDNDIRTGMEELNVTKNVSAVGSLQSVYQLFPPNRFEVEFQYSEDFFTKEKDKVVQYYICSLNSDGKETNYKTSDEIHFSDDVKSVFANLDWDGVNGADGYIIYRRINTSFSYVKLASVELSMLDILVPRNFTKIDWKNCSEPENINRTVLVVNKFSTLGENYITGGGLGIGIVNPQSALHIVSNDVNSDGTPLIVEMGENRKGDMLRMVRRGLSLNGGVKISGECAEGKSLIEMGKNIKILADDEGVCFLGRKTTMNDEDINEKLGSDTFTVQATDGGIYTVGELMMGEGKAIGSFNNRLGNHAGIIRTGCISNSIGNQVSFAWEGEELKAIPFNDGSMLTKKKVSVKNFTIQHPTIEDRYLVHACLEGATADVFYRGVNMIEIGQKYVDVELPDFYGELVQPGSSTLQLTVSGEPFFRLGGEIFESRNMIRVYLDNTYNKVCRFYWEVKGERKNTAFDGEPLKKDVKVCGFGPYTYYI